MAKKGKGIPKTATSRPRKKEVRSKPQNIDSKPSWRFSTVDKEGPFAWPVGQEKELEIVQKLHSFDSMKWSDIKGKAHHAIPVYRLSKIAQKRLEEIHQDDIDEIFSFHLQGKPRIICIPDGNTAKLLWYDPEHAVCPSEKKHT